MWRAFGSDIKDHLYTGMQDDHRKQTEAPRPDCFGECINAGVFVSPLCIYTAAAEGCALCTMTQI